MTKNELRKKYNELRNRLSEEEVMNKSRKIIDALIRSAWYKNSSVIMTYVGFHKEVDTKGFIRYALADGKRIAVPITDKEQRTLIVSEIKDLDNELEISTFGILEPKKEYIRVIKDETIDLIIVPGLVFDLQGYRIGYGGGYYDRFLQRLKHNVLTVGMAFDFQLVESLPYEAFDRNVDHIITDERII